MAQKVPLACGHTITVDGSLKMKDFRGWVAAEERGDIEAVYGYLVKMVKSWDWEGLDPSMPESYDELEMREYRQVVQAVSDYIRGDITAKN
jgi:hypothetical protein